MEKKETSKKKISLRKKLLFSIVIVAAVISIASCLIGYIRYNETLRQLYNDNGFVVGEIILNQIDCDKVAQYAETWEEDEYYGEMKQLLVDVQEASGAKYVYMVIPAGRNEDGIGLMRYIYDSSGMQLGDTDPVTKYYEDMEYTYENGVKSGNRYERKSAKYGWLTSSVLPVNDSTGKTVALLLVDTAMELIVSTLVSYILTVALIAAALVALFCVAYWKFMQHSFIAPIELIRQNTHDFAQNGAQTDDTLEKIRTGDELQELAESVSTMESAIVEYIDNIKNITAEKERIGAELNVATNIQKSVLPCIFPAFPERSDFDIYATMNPAKEVGGDFYDFFMIDDSHLALLIADVSGKGVPAALFMMIGKLLIKNRALQGGTPGEIFTVVNKQLCENNKMEMFITAWLGIIDLKTGIMTATSAGHEYPAIRHGDGQFEIFRDRHGFVLAGMEMSRYRDYTLQLKPGDMLYVYTDGVTEATNANNVLFGEGRMIEALNTYNGKDCRETIETVLNSISRFVGEAPQFDDITMLCMRLDELMK